MIRRALILLGIAGIAGLLAFPLRNAVYNAVIVPLAYVLWILGLWYHAVHQVIWWIVVIVFVSFVLIRSLLPGFKPAVRVPIKSKPVVGQVESLAVWVKRAERGIYFKWLVANRLGKIAHQILTHRETGKPRSVFDPLTGSDWDPNDRLQLYLESGLHKSFADFPHVNKPFSHPQQTPLDHDVNEVVEFLETQVKN
jgi:hypothetical protein